MKFTAEELFDIAYEEYADADFLPERGSVKWHEWREGVGQWAYYAAQEDYDSEEQVREELRGYITEERN